MALAAVAAGLSFCQPLLVNLIIRSVTAGRNPMTFVADLVIMMVVAAMISCASGYVLALIAPVHRVDPSYAHVVVHVPTCG